MNYSVDVRQSNVGSTLGAPIKGGAELYRVGGMLFSAFDSPDRPFQAELKNSVPQNRRRGLYFEPKASPDTLSERCATQTLSSVQGTNRAGYMPEMSRS